MSFENIVNSFEKFDQSIQLLQQEIGYSYLEGLIESGENIIDGGEVQVQDGKPSANTVEELEQIYSDIGLKDFTSSEIRQVIQLATIKSIKEDYTQPNHQMTPDTIGNFIAFLINQFITGKSQLAIADLAVGTGNLLSTVYHFLSNNDNQLVLTGIDNDELLISLASMSMTLQNLQVNLIHEDSLSNLLIDPQDVIVSDLPVGYYPLDEKAEKFEVSNEDDNSYIHHLMIEQGIKYLKESGYGFYLVPSDLFESEEGSKLLDFIQDKGYFQGLVSLPSEMFAHERAKKSILIFQKKGEEAKQAKEVLLAQTPDFKNTDKMKEFASEISVWIQENIKNN